MLSPYRVPIGKPMDQSGGPTDQIIPFHLFLNALELFRPHQGCRLIESTDYGRMNPKLARFCAKVIDEAIIASQSLNKFFSPRIPILSFTSFCSQKTLTSNFFPLYISGALIAHNNQ